MLTLGGDHFISYPLLKAHAKKHGTLSLVHFDAHSDTWPDTDMWNRLYAADPRFRFVPRLTVVRFPASGRRDVYRQRPCHEQKHWWERIRNEPDLEPRLLADMVVRLHPEPRPPTLRERVAARLARKPKGELHFFEERRKFKGLEPKS